MKVKIIIELPLSKENRDALPVGSVHETIEAPKEYAKNTRMSERWVEGANKEPVKLLRDEFEVVAK